MKNLRSFLILQLAASICLTSCDRANKTTEAVVAPEEAAHPEIPLLPVNKGDVWIYNVHLKIPEDTTSPGAAEVDENHQRTRTYLGKSAPAEGLPEVDCFEVTAPASPTEREYVDISDERILMRGSMIMRPETTRPMWLDHPVPFVIAGMKAGTEFPQIQAGGGLSRKTQVIAREEVTVPAGKFPSIRLLMSGSDGDLELRRTIWFSPGTGIVREERTRYRLGKVIFQETQELAKTTRNLPK